MYLHAEYKTGKYMYLAVDRKSKKKKKRIVSISNSFGGEK